MARIGQSRVTSANQFVDQLAFSALTSTYPSRLVDEVLTLTGRHERRERLLPAWLVVYYVMALELYPALGYREVLGRVLSTVGPSGGALDPAGPVPSSPAISKARARLGSAVFIELFRRVCPDICDVQRTCDRYRRWQLITAGQALFAAPATKANMDRYGLADGDSIPVRVAGLAESRTRLIFDAKAVDRRISEWELWGRLGQDLGPGHLVVTSATCPDEPLWAAVRARGADLLWKNADYDRPMTAESLPDGSSLCRMQRPGAAGSPRLQIVRRLVGPDGPDAETRESAQRIPLFTTILDPVAAPAADLIGLYNARWGMDSLAAGVAPPSGPLTVLRGRDPVGVEQEIWAYLLVHHVAVRRPEIARSSDDPAYDVA
jgi:hypothetical protein